MPNPSPTLRYRMRQRSGPGFLKSSTGRASPWIRNCVRPAQRGDSRPCISHLRQMDYLETRDDVDPKRIGVIGISKGGTETYLAAAADTRIAAAVPCISVQSFRWALDNNRWQARVGTIQPAVQEAAQSERVALNAQFVRTFYDRVVPGIYSEFD